MERNVGKNDKIIRIIVAIIAAYLGYKVNVWFYLITLVSLVTALRGYCLLYSLLGINTAKKSKNK